MIAVNDGLARHRHVREVGRSSIGALRIDGAQITERLRAPITISVSTLGIAP